MIHMQQITTHRFNRFLIVGAGNTAINFAILNTTAIWLNLNKTLSVVIATSCAILFSYAMNRSFVFNDRQRQFRKFVSFTIIAAGGVLIIQTSVYTLSAAVLSGYLSSSLVVINLSNLIASLCVMLWNYNGYRLLVFKSNVTKPRYDRLSDTDKAA